MSRKRHSRSAKKRDVGPSGPRPFWSGTISFGLVSVPVNLFPAKRTAKVSLRNLAPDGTPVQQRYHCPREDRDIHPEHIVRGFPIDDDQYVVVRDEELEALEPEKSRDIDLREFVDIAEVPPALFERPYFLAPAGDSTKAYRLLAEVMEDTGRAGIATFVMRDKEYLVAILSEQGILRAETLRFAEELRTPKQIGLPARQDPPESRVKQFEREVKKLTVKELPRKKLADPYVEALHQLVQRKLKSGKNIVEVDRPPEADDEESAGGYDLLDAIKRSMRGVADRGSGDGNGKSGKASAADDLERQTKGELYERAKALDVPGRSQMSKSELVKALRERYPG